MLLAGAACGMSSSLSLSASPDRVTFGPPATLIAVVSPVTATGKVTFYQGLTILGTASPSAGRAVLATSTLNTSEPMLKARYMGDSNFSPSTSHPEGNPR